MVLGLVALLGYAMHAAVSPPVRGMGLSPPVPRPSIPLPLTCVGPLPTERVTYRHRTSPSTRGCHAPPLWDEVSGGGVKLTWPGVNNSSLGELGFEGGDILWTLNGESFTDGMQRLIHEKAPPRLAVGYERKGQQRLKIVKLRD